MRLPEIVNEHFADPYHCGSCEGATHVAECRADGRPCIVRMELLVRDGVIREAWFEAEGCECCEGLASLLVEYVEGKGLEELQHISVAEVLDRDDSAGSEAASDEGANEGWPGCWQLPLQTLQTALASPLDAVDEELGDFSGPSLREEC